jgi:hypothetical protein
VLGVARSVYLGSRMNNLYVQRFKAEYLLKSSVNIARSVIALDKTNVDPPLDGWGPFRKGFEVPVDILGISDPNTSVALEINGVAKSMPLKALRSDPSHLWRDAFVRLFKSPDLDFDNDKEVDQSGLFPNKVFKSEELVANLIDYMDADHDSYHASNFPDGIEDLIPKERFTNTYIESIDELSAIPGFTERRIRKLRNFVNPYELQVDINLASTETLKAIDPNISDEQAKALHDYIDANGGLDPTSGSPDLTTFLPSLSNTTQNVFFFHRSTNLKILSKVQFGDSKFFAEAIVTRHSGGLLPPIVSLELFG